MSESDLAKLMARFEYVRQEYNTPEKARALLQQEGILDENGEYAEAFRDTGDLVCR